MSALWEVAAVRKLLSADFSRLWINRTFWLAVMIMVGLEGVCCLAMLKSDDIPVDAVLFISLQGISILAAIFFSLFLGTEYSDGTIRNKLIAGHKRSNIYLASLITGVAAVTVIYMAEVLTGAVLGMLLYAAPYNSISQIVIAGGIGWLACAAFVSIFNMIGMLSSSKSLTAIICMLTAFVLLFLGLYTFQALTRPDYLSEVKRAVCQILFEINPFGQILQTMSISVVSPWKLIAYALLLSLLSTGFGLFFFTKKDLK